MIPRLVDRLRALLLVLPVVALPAGCGKAVSDSASVRFVNASTASSSLDLYAGENRLFGSLPTRGTTSFSDIDEGTYAFSVRLPSNSSILTQSSVALETDQSRTLVAYGSDSAVKLAVLTDDDGAPASGYAGLRVLNTTGESGTLDVFLTAASDSIDSVTATVAGAGSGTLTNFTTLAAGTYRLRVAASDDRSDLRMDLGSYTLADQSRVTLVVMPSSGGYLVDLMSIREGGDIVALQNTNARVRLVAGQDGTGVVSAAIGDTAVATGARSPSIGAYVWLPAGDSALTTTLDGTSLTRQTVTLTAGSDYTLLVHGSASASYGSTLLADDNHLSTSTTKGRMRLVNGLAGSSDLSLTLDYAALASSVGYPSASAYASFTATTTGRLDLYSAQQTAALWTNTSTSLVAGGVYSVFALGSPSAPTVVLRKDR